MEIIVNARRMPFLENEISYEQIVELAGYTDYDYYTVVFQRGRNGQSGFIYKGKSIMVSEGLVINIALTDNA